MSHATAEIRAGENVEGAGSAFEIHCRNEARGMRGSFLVGRVSLLRFVASFFFVACHTRYTQIDPESSRLHSTTRADVKYRPRVQLLRARTLPITCGSQLRINDINTGI